MRIKYFGHSCFTLDFGAGAKIATDPFGDVGFPIPHIEADAVTVSHGHYDHCNVSAVTGAKAFDRAGEYEIGGVKIVTLPCFHDEVRGAKRGKNLIFLFTHGDLTVCHFGDLGEPLADFSLSLPHIDVLMIPVGGVFTIDGVEAANYVKKLSPSVIIPMHYKTKGLTVPVEPVDRFLSALKNIPVERAGSEIILEKSVSKQKIILMERNRTCSQP